MMNDNKLCITVVSVDMAVDNKADITAVSVDTASDNKVDIIAVRRHSTAHCSTLWSRRRHSYPSWSSL